MRSEQVDYLSKLGLKDPVSKDQIKSAFRELIKKHHPDVMRVKDGVDHRNQAITRDLIVAYDWLMRNHVVDQNEGSSPTNQESVIREAYSAAEEVKNQASIARDLLGPVFDIEGKVRAAELVWRISLACLFLFVTSSAMKMSTTNGVVFKFIVSMETAWGLWLLGTPRDLDRFYGNLFFSRLYPLVMQRALKPRYWVMLFIIFIVYAIIGGMR